MKNKKRIILVIIFFIIFVLSIFGLERFRQYVNNSDGEQRSYIYGEAGGDDYLSVNVEMTDSWVKALPDDFKIDEHFTDSKFASRNGINQIECIGRTVEVTLENVSVYRISRWDLEYDVPCDMYFDKAWNGDVEIHQFGDEHVDTISTKEMPVKDTDIIYEEADELYLIPLKKGDRIIYHPIDFEYPLAEEYSNNEGEVKETTIGFIVYTEDDSFTPDDFKVRYKLVKGIEDYRLYSVLSFVMLASGVMALGIAIFAFVSARYDRIHEHDMEVVSQAIGTFSKFIDSKDRYTHNHSYRVAGYSKLIAHKYGMTDEECDHIYYIGLLHDTGKVLIDDRILNKPGRLTKQEYEIIKSHTTKGAELLKDFTAIKDISVGALYHHERYDGKGYPSGLSGGNIPLVARIICVADAYDAMSSNRVYRAHLDKETIIEQLTVNKGKQFDPEIVDIFLSCLESGEVDSVRRSCIES